MNNSKSKNPLIKENLEALSSFIENINCLYETFQYSELMLKQQKRDCNKAIFKKLEDWGLDPNRDSGEIELSSDKVREVNKLIKKQRRAESAFDLIPRSYIVSLISLFDAFIGNLIRNIYAICPEKLNSSDQKISFSELVSFGSIEEAKDTIVENKIESILRESHHDQFDFIAKELAISTLKEFENWPNFIEITQRRNLFVHTNALVSSQYLSVCKKHKVKGIDSLSKGDKLDVNREYFENAFTIFYEIAVKLSQIVLRVLLGKKNETVIEELDDNLITIIFDLIAERRYKIAIELSNFALMPKFKHNNATRIYMILNMAQAFKWNGNNEKCVEILEKEDSSAWNNELKMAKEVLLDRNEKAIILMEAIGSQSKIFDMESYRTWPIFNKIRSTDIFKETFNKIFNEPLDYDTKFMPNFPSE